MKGKGDGGKKRTEEGNAEEEGDDARKVNRIERERRKKKSTSECPKQGEMLIVRLIHFSSLLFLLGRGRALILCFSAIVAIVIMLCTFWSVGAG